MCVCKKYSERKKTPSQPTVTKPNMKNVRIRMARNMPPMISLHFICCHHSLLVSFLVPRLNAFAPSISASDLSSMSSILLPRSNTLVMLLCMISMTSFTSSRALATWPPPPPPPPPPLFLSPPKPNSSSLELSPSRLRVTSGSKRTWRLNLGGMVGWKKGKELKKEYSPSFFWGGWRGGTSVQ